MGGGDFATDLGMGLFGCSQAESLSLVWIAEALSVVLNRGFGSVPAAGGAVHGSVFRVLMNHFQDFGFWGTRLGGQRLWPWD